MSLISRTDIFLIKYKDQVIYTLLGLCVLSCLIFYNLSTEKRGEVTEYFHLIGGILGIIGFVILYMQLFSVKTINANIQIALETNTEKINSVLAYSSLSMSGKFIEEIKLMLSNNKPELALLRYGDLKKILLLIDTSKVDDVDFITEFDKNKKKFLKDIELLSGHVHSGKPILTQVILTNLENLTSSIIILENLAKKQVI